MPEFSYQQAVDPGVVGFQLFIFPLITMLTFPNMVNLITSESTARLVEMMEIEGMHIGLYWVGNYVYFFFVDFVLLHLFLVLAYVASLETFTHASPSIWVGLFVLWIHAKIGMAFFISALFRRRARVGSLFAYVLVLVTAITCAIMNASMTPWKTQLFMLPFLAFSRALALIFYNGGDVVKTGSELSICLVFLFFFGAIFLAAGVFIHFLMPQEVELGAIFELFVREAKRTKRTFVSRMRGVKTSWDESLLGGLLADSDRPSDLREDSDVIAERERVTQILNSDDFSRSPVLIMNLKKSYHSGTTVNHAVRGLTFGISSGECFGLLGPNGCGKTTTLNILTGLLHPSSGLCLVDGVDVETKSVHARSVLGVCPQFDVVWDELTVSEHFTFYARVKGIPPSEERACVMSVATKVGLDGDAYGMTAKSLSGGMRRRLSLGIALIGAPKVVLLDEPTTGVDPDTRRSIWDLIEREKSEGRSFIITTHSMEEADVLCTRIGIMSEGLLRCIGTQLTLKKKFGDGFHLSFLIAPTIPEAEIPRQIEILEKFVHDLTAAAAGAAAAQPSRASALISHYQRNVVFLLPSSTSIGDVFERTEAAKQRLGVAEWGVTQTSLESVFFKIVSQEK
eukprot:TRINITY_DN2126_c0_g1_i2.p2 TRINITY_DN2126_c0_g1~~TRINITY_DN2126_c0_g1_i2.p2  ORF type:complete len:624 (+),score=164.82 TRINITY_DN2126_c0_g1_i2:3710-5581(+)